MNVYEKDGKWYALQEVDKTTKVERPAREDEIPAQDEPVAEKKPKGKARK